MTTERPSLDLAALIERLHSRAKWRRLADPEIAAELDEAADALSRLKQGEDGCCERFRYGSKKICPDCPREAQPSAPESKQEGGGSDRHRPDIAEPGQAQPSAPAPRAGLETSAEERASWKGWPSSYQESPRDKEFRDYHGRLLRDFDRLLAQVEAETERCAQIADGLRGAYGKAGSAKEQYLVADQISRTIRSKP